MDDIRISGFFVLSRSTNKVNGKLSQYNRERPVNSSNHIDMERNKQLKSLLKARQIHNKLKVYINSKYDSAQVPKQEM